MDNRVNTLPRAGLRAAMLLLLSAAAHCSYAQNPTVRSYITANEDRKNYSTEIVPAGAGTAGVVMSGTFFDRSGVAGNPNWTEFVRTDNDGVVQVWNRWQEDGFEDERCVDIAVNVTDHNEYFLTSLVRENRSGNYKDMIKIYHVDYGGNLVNSNIIESLAGSGAPYTNLFPVHSLYDDATGALFICGYALMDGILQVANNEGPSYHGGLISGRYNKAAFVMKVDPTTLTMLNFEMYDYTYTPTGTFGVTSIYNCPSNYDPTNWNPVNQPTTLFGDYDMAMRLTKLSSGKIHVTGSVTALYFTVDDPTTAPGPNWTSQNSLASGIMNVVIDPNAAPNTQMLIHNEPFLDEKYDYSFGVGIFQDGNTGHFYLLGNHHTPEIRTSAGTIDDKGGFEPYMHGMFFANLEDAGGNPMPRYNPDPEVLFNNFGPPYNAPLADYSLIAYGARNSQVENWAVTNLQGPSTAANNDVLQWVAGYRANSSFVSACSHAYPPTLSNVTPSLSLWDLGWNTTTGIQANILYTKDHMTQGGTGADIYGNNSYRQLGDGLSNIGWPPTFATGDYVSNTTDPDIIMAVPIYTGDLNLKFIRANVLDGTTLRSSTDYCPGSVEDCARPLEAPSHVLHPQGLEMDRSYLVSLCTVTYPTSVNNAGVSTPTESECFLTGAYKPGKTTAVAGINKTNNETRVHPNPAQQYVQVALANSVGAKQEVRIELTGMYGQVVSILYQGNAAALSSDKQLQLPALAAGLYMVQVYADGQRICNQKLNIVQ